MKSQRAGTQDSNNDIAAAANSARNRTEQPARLRTKDWAGSDSGYLQGTMGLTATRQEPFSSKLRSRRLFAQSCTVFPEVGRRRRDCGCLDPQRISWTRRPCSWPCFEISASRVCLAEKSRKSLCSGLHSHTRSLSLSSQRSQPEEHLLLSDEDPASSLSAARACSSNLSQLQ